MNRQKCLKLILEGFKKYNKYNKNLTLVTDRVRRIKGKTSKLLEVVLEEKRREIKKEWIDSGRTEDINIKL